jgi:hypothetical protein
MSSQPLKPQLFASFTSKRSGPKGNPRLTAKRSYSVATAVQTADGRVLPHAHFLPLKLRQSCLQLALKVEPIPIDDPTCLVVHGRKSEESGKYEYEVRVQASCEPESVVFSKTFSVEFRWDFLNIRSGFFSDDDFEDLVDNTVHPFELILRNQRCSYVDALGKGTAAYLSLDGKRHQGTITAEVDVAQTRLLSCMMKLESKQKREDPIARKNLMDYFEKYVPYYLGLLLNILNKPEELRTNKYIDLGFFKEILCTVAWIYKVLIKPAEVWALKFLMGVKQGEVKADYYLNGQEEADQLDQLQLLETAKALFIRINTVAGPDYNTLESVLKNLDVKQSIELVRKNILALKSILYRHMDSMEAVKTKISEVEADILQRNETRRENDRRANELGLFWRIHPSFTEEVMFGLYSRLLESEFKQTICLAAEEKFQVPHKNTVYFKPSAAGSMTVVPKGVLPSMLEQEIPGMKLPTMIESSVRGFYHKILMLVQQPKDSQMNELLIYSDKLRRVSIFPGTASLKYNLHHNVVLVLVRNKDVIDLELYSLKLYKRVAFNISKHLLEDYGNQRPDLQLKATHNDRLVLVNWIDYKSEEDVVQKFMVIKKDETLKILKTYKLHHMKRASAHEDISRLKVESFPVRGRIVTVVMNEQLAYRLVHYFRGTFTHTNWKYLHLQFPQVSLLREKDLRFGISWDYSLQAFMVFVSSGYDHSQNACVLKLRFRL